MYLTKYVSGEFFESTKKGFLKFGTLASYRTIESGADLRMTDTEEGVSEAFIKDDIYNGTVEVGGFSLQGVTITDCKESIVVRNELNAHVYCLVGGPYLRDHHQAFNDKNGDNVRNFVMFDSALFARATQALFTALQFLENDIFHRKVKYLPSKRMELKLEELSSCEVNSFRAIFGKSDKFAYENEYRFAIPSKRPIVDLYTENFSQELRSKFSDAVVDYGSL